MDSPRRTKGEGRRGVGWSRTNRRYYPPRAFRLQLDRAPTLPDDSWQLISLQQQRLCLSVRAYFFPPSRCYCVCALEISNLFVLEGRVRGV
jgi:hypothetical protein